jgi:hypothetical protein
MTSSAGFIDRLRKAGLVNDEPERQTRPRYDVPVAKLGDPEARRYALGALQAECLKLANTPEGQRGEQANISGFNVGTIVETGHITEQEAYEAIIDAGAKCGLPLDEVQKKAGGGLKAGVSKGGRVIQLRPNAGMPPAYTLDPSVDGGFWESREVHRHIRTFARSRRASPWAVMGVILARCAAAIEPEAVLPPLVGGEGSLNQFVALVGRSGGGKGAAEAAGHDAISLPETKHVGIGSGEGILHQYVKNHPATKTEPAYTETIASRVMFGAAEVDQLAALKGRTGSTLLPMLRDAWSGSQLGFAYVDETKRLTIPGHRYRLCLTVGVQPGRGAILLDDSDGGTPQRFLWMPTTDIDVPAQAPDNPGRWEQWQLPHMGKADSFTGNYRIPVCEAAVRAIDDAAVARHRGEVEAIDGHSLLCRLKTAVSLAILDNRLEVRDSDWELSETVMQVSDATRESVHQYLAAAVREANESAAKAYAVREVRADEARRASALQRVSERVRKQIAADGPVSRGQVRRRSTSSDRDYVDEVLDALTAAGSIVTESNEHRGQKTVGYRLVKEEK